MFGSVQARLVGSLLIVLLASSCQLAAAETTTAPILQLKNDRLYFGVGSDELIFKNSRFYIELAGETIYSDLIAAAYDGVSYSRPTASFFDTIKIETCQATVEQAQIDSVSTINISCDKIHPTLLNRNSSDWGRRPTSPKPACFDDRNINGNRICYKQSTETDYLTTQLDKQAADAVISFDRINSASAPNSVQSQPAPFIAVMIPNLTKAVNRQALFPISLYYQFNEQHLPQMFAGSETSPVHNLFGPDSSSQRFYPFDPHQGSQLLKRLNDRPSLIRIAVLDSPLEGTANYLADLLARERIKTSFTDDPHAADLILLFVPYYKTFRSASLEHIYATLASFGTNDRLPLEILPQIQDRLIKIRETADTTNQLNLSRQIDRMMKEDLGVFPLFQPTIYLKTEADLLNLTFDADNFPKLKTLTKVTLPNLEREAQR